MNQTFAFSYSSVRISDECLKSALFRPPPPTCPRPPPTPPPPKGKLPSILVASSGFKLSRTRCFHFLAKSVEAPEWDRLLPGSTRTITPIHPAPKPTRSAQKFRADQFPIVLCLQDIYSWIRLFHRNKLIQSFKTALQCKIF